MASSDRGGRWGRWRRASVVVVVLVISVGVGFFSARATLTAPGVDEGPLEPTLVEVVEGTVERVQAFTAQAQWDSTLVATAGLPGTVTSIAVADGAALAASPGTIVYDVNLIPIVVFAGPVPAFRDLEAGVAGEDVRQLQEGLAAVGFDSGTADGRFDAGVTNAVQSWQRSLGVETTGRVINGQVRFVPTLPATLVLAEGIEVGRQLAGSEEAIRALAPAPRFSIPLSPEQRDLVPLDVPVILTHPDGEWSAVIVTATEAPEDGQPVLRLTLATADGGPVCSDRCDLVATSGITDFPAEIILVPATTGPVIPSAAVRTDARGATSVVMADGGIRPITIQAQAQGQAVVDGLDLGEQIRLPGIGG